MKFTENLEKCGGQPNLLNTFHISSLLIVLKALVVNESKEETPVLLAAFSCSKRATNFMSTLLCPYAENDAVILALQCVLHM